ncbi:1024_t:CDS:2 [Funneliformis geosporum]|uniref:19720_t:CDS:1 n=1 Tax=Funneliformis geosporum TaxID=1117311 RepID=A0A9W4X489_9GLOM|nr:19720_t:CDS:2 [Funneliformis geosporum]CAI2185672.1 1024_t:CDS:2 [Funneliformis geosporum]
MTFSGPSHSAAGANKQGNKPVELFCYGCEKMKPQYAFSKTQIAKTNSNISNPYAPGGRTKKQHHTICKQCTPQQNETLTCMLCTRTMPLEKFAKAQRKNAEKARCSECMIKREEEDIDDSEPEDDDFDGPRYDTWDDIL